MRVLVCGGRDYPGDVRPALERLHAGADGPIRVLIHGEAPGADRKARAWALANGVLVMGFPADWKNHGRTAGPIRNGEMLAVGRPDLVVAFPGGRGTADMVRQAQKAGVPVLAAT